MQELDLWLLLILTYTMIGHIYLNAYEEHTVQTNRIVVEAVVILALFCVMMGIVEYNVNGW